MQGDSQEALHTQPPSRNSTRMLYRPSVSLPVTFQIAFSLSRVILSSSDWMQFQAGLTEKRKLCVPVGMFMEELDPIGHNVQWIVPVHEGG